jgi:hypothetical protein
MIIAAIASDRIVWLNAEPPAKPYTVPQLHDLLCAFAIEHVRAAKDVRLVRAWVDARGVHVCCTEWCGYDKEHWPKQYRFAMDAELDAGGLLEEREEPVSACPECGSDIGDGAFEVLPDNTVIGGECATCRIWCVRERE